MNQVKILFIALLLIGCSGVKEEQQEIQQTETVYQFENGLWYDGGSFQQKTMWVVDGVFITNPPESTARTVVDLKNGYVVPAFGEAHHHTVLCDADRIQQFMQAGVFYVQIMNATVSSKKCQAEFHDKPTAPDISNALAGITSLGGHPTQIGRYFLEEDKIEGEWVYSISSEQELEEKWPVILAGNHDFLKIFLSHSEDYELIQLDEDISPFYKGLNPDLIKPIVDLAQKSNLRVAAHVVTANDFQVAVEAGVDQIAHLSGFAPGPIFTPESKNSWLNGPASKLERYLITSESAELAARKDIKVITTVSGIESTKSDLNKDLRKELGDEIFNIHERAVSENITRLKEAGVTILIGSDRGEFTSVDEAIFLVDKKLLPSWDVFASLAIDTPKAIFPNRKIGSLSKDSEATFLVLERNPLEDIKAIRSIVFRFKDGVAVSNENK